MYWAEVSAATVRRSSPQERVDVFLSDSGRIADRYRMKLEAWGVPYEEGGHSEERILAASECVKSPGIPDSAPIVRKLRERGVPVISEIEFAGALSRRCAHDLHHRFERQDDHHVARLPDSARRGAATSPWRHIGESFAYSVATGRYDWYCSGTQLVPADGCSGSGPTSVC